jgi:hypothetical protein
VASYSDIFKLLENSFFSNQLKILGISSENTATTPYSIEMLYKALTEGNAELLLGPLKQQAAAFQNSSWISSKRNSTL